MSIYRATKMNNKHKTALDAVSAQGGISAGKLSSIKELKKSLRKLGIKGDEGPKVSDPFNSEHRNRYLCEIRSNRGIQRMDPN